MTLLVSVRPATYHYAYPSRSSRVAGKLATIVKADGDMYDCTDPAWTKYCKDAAQAEQVLRGLGPAMREDSLARMNQFIIGMQYAIAGTLIIRSRVSDRKNSPGLVLEACYATDGLAELLRTG